MTFNQYFPCVLNDNSTVLLGGPYSITILTFIGKVICHDTAQEGFPVTGCSYTVTSFILATEESSELNRLGPPKLNIELREGSSESELVILKLFFKTLSFSDSVAFEVLRDFTLNSIFQLLLWCYSVQKDT